MKAAGTRPRLAVVLSHPTQYYSPWFRWLAQRTAVELRVFYLWEFGVTAKRDRQFGATFKWDVDLLSGYEHEFVPNVAADPGTHHFRGLRNPELTRRLSAWAPHAALLFGYKWESHLRAVAWARWNNVPLLFRGDSHFLGRGRPSVSTRLPMSLLFRQFDAFLPVGAANADYFKTLGVSAQRLFHAPHSVNATLFDPAHEPHKAAAVELAQRLGIEAGTRIVVYAGKFVPAKQPLQLLEAFLSINAAGTALVFVGDGPDKSALLKRAAGDPRVHFLPFANQSEMPSRYLLGDLFALPSRGYYETWGLAVNEAMHMGVPCLVSDLVGCQRDLVTDGETGWVFEHSGVDTLRTKLAEALNLLSNRSACTEMKSRITQRISGYTYEKTTHGLLTALRSLGLEA